MKYFFSTLCVRADKYITDTLNQLGNNEISINQAFENLMKIESYDDKNNPYFPDADMTKETKYDFVENISLIKDMDEDDIWLIYDEVFNK